MSAAPKGFAWARTVPDGTAVACRCSYMTTDETLDKALDAMKRLHTCSFS